MPAFTRPDRDEYAAEHACYLDFPAVSDNALAHLKTQGLTVLHLLRSLDDEGAEYRYAPDKWSIKELVGHLIDTERLFVFRALWIARGSDAAQPGVDENVWAGASNAGRRPLAALWREHHVARTDHLYLLKSLDKEVLTRRGTADGGPLSVRAVPWIIAGHEYHHLQILRERYGLDF